MVRQQRYDLNSRKSCLMTKLITSLSRLHRLKSLAFSDTQNVCLQLMSKFLDSFLCFSLFFFTEITVPILPLLPSFTLFYLVALFEVFLHDYLSLPLAPF